MTRLILIRHGETDWNLEGRYQGQADPSLNSKGLEQAKILADALAEFTHPLQRIYTSPLKRSSQTAQILSDRLNIPMHLEPRIMEINQGDWQTRLRAEIENLYPDLFRRWETEPWDVTPPRGEHLRDVLKRVLAAIDEIILQHPDETIGIVAHRVPIALIKMRYQGLEPDIVRTLHLPNTYYEEINIPLDENENTVEEKPTYRREKR